MEMVAGEPQTGDPRVVFDRRLKLEFHGSRVTSEAGLLALREDRNRAILPTIRGGGAAYLGNVG